MVFLETDSEDRASVLERFPNAVFVDGTLSGDALVERCKDAEVISAFIHTAFPASVIALLPKLKLLCTRSVGYDHIDVPACRQRGIVVCNVPDYGSHVIAEHVFALLLSTMRHIPEADKRTEQGIFDYHGLRGVCLKDKTIAVVGTGKIGRRVAKIARGFDMDILAVDKCRTIELERDCGVKYVELDEALERSDIVTLHVPSLPDTEHLINAKTLAKMKNGVILVNTARGSLIDSKALLSALKSGKVRYALLDVLEHEANFEQSKALVHHPSVVSTPHIAFYADDSMRNMYLDCFLSISDWMAGKNPQHEIHPEAVVCDLSGVKS